MEKAKTEQMKKILDGASSCPPSRGNDHMGFSNFNRTSADWVMMTSRIKPWRMRLTSTLTTFRSSTVPYSRMAKNLIYHRGP